MEAQKATVVCAALFVLLAACAEAAVPLSSRTTCTDPETNKVHSLDETWFTTGERGCMRLTCDGEDTISGLTCAQFQVPSWCSVKPGNRKAVYPDCCPTPVCPEENAIEGSSASTKAAHKGDFGGYPYPPAY
ncbi:U-scoloptoxin(16)-Er12a-like [Thrips palmi]|uniref:U-scoloptoxin(16)-Er12a-like n=1 Tax=Thrips palmi TaxID=161013 RepID=A0A6P8Z1W3_THRPL|nr:U-scoloptoxin(16)-Er12a-like [Thrips palmi]